MSPLVVINGRFLAAQPTGVQRCALRLLIGLDALVAAGGVDLRLVLMRPQGTEPPQLAATEDRQLPARGQAFEQLALPLAARGGLLVNLANVGPVAHGRSVVLMHDVQTRTAPASYSAAFRLWYAALQPILARRALAVATVSAYSAGQLARFGRAGRGGLASIVPNGADHVLEAAPDASVLTGHRLEPGGFVLAFASAQPHKGTATLLRAGMGAGQPPLALVGAAPKGMAAPPGTRFLGRVTDGELRALYEAAMALAVPSRTEGFGLPAIEAMACGCPVLAARAGALPEVCDGAALMVPPGDVRAWREALRRVATDPELWARLSISGRRRANELTWRAAAGRLADVIEACLAAQAEERVRPRYPSARPSATPAR